MVYRKRKFKKRVFKKKMSSYKRKIKSFIKKKNFKKRVMMTGELKSINYTDGVLYPIATWNAYATKTCYTNIQVLAGSIS